MRINPLIFCPSFTFEMFFPPVPNPIYSDVSRSQCSMFCFVVSLVFDVVVVRLQLARATPVVQVRLLVRLSSENETPGINRGWKLHLLDSGGNIVALKFL